MHVYFVMSGLHTTQEGLSHLKCPQCDFQGFYEEQYTDHVRKHTECALERCKCCSYVCFRNDELIAHYLVSTGCWEEGGGGGGWGETGVRGVVFSSLQVLQLCHRTFLCQRRSYKGNPSAYQRRWWSPTADYKL